MRIPPAELVTALSSTSPAALVGLRSKPAPPGANPTTYDCDGADASAAQALQKIIAEIKTPMNVRIWSNDRPQARRTRDARHGIQAELRRCQPHGWAGVS